MSNTDIATWHGKVTRVETVGHSRNGNPTKKVAIESENGDIRVFLTAPNSSLAYVIGNSEYRDKAHTFYVDRKGRIGSRAGS